MRGLLIATLLLPGCSSSPDSSQEPCLDERLDELLKVWPDDPDLLFLRHDGKHLEECRRLLEAKPVPMVLASVADIYGDHLSEAKDRERFKDVLQAWSSADSTNALPTVLQGLLEVSDGDLMRGVASLTSASEKTALRTYSVDVRREALRIHRKLGWIDVVELGAVARFTGVSRTMRVLDSIRLLEVLALEWELRAKPAEALLAGEAAHRLSLLLFNDQLDCVEASVAAELLGRTASRLWDLQMGSGQARAAEATVVRVREYWREAERVRRAVKKHAEENPLAVAMKDAGFELGNAWPEFEVLYALVRSREATIRPYLEAEFEKGSATSALQRLTEAELREINSSRSPLDSYLEIRSSLIESAPKLIDAATTTYDADNPERDYTRERAFHQVLRSREDLRVREVLQTWFEKEEDPSALCVVFLVAAGVKNERVKTALWKRIESVDYIPGAHWAVAQLQLKEAIPQLLRDFGLEIRSRSLRSGSYTAIPLYFALRELTGQDFGFHEDRWTDWGVKNGHLKPD